MLGMFFLQYPDMMVIETFSCNACKKNREEINAIAMLALLFQERCYFTQKEPDCISVHNFHCDLTAGRKF